MIPKPLNRFFSRLKKPDQTELIFFGLAVSFFFIALEWSLLHTSNKNLFITPITILVLTLAIFYQKPLAVLYYPMTFIGLLLGKVNTIIVLCLLYFIFFVGYGIIYKLLGKDPLKVRSSKLTSFWISVHSNQTNLKRQF
jgi:hypothetical protein